jgi:hypothetical protein
LFSSLSYFPPWICKRNVSLAKLLFLAMLTTRYSGQIFSLALRTTLYGLLYKSRLVDSIWPSLSHAALFAYALIIMKGQYLFAPNLKNNKISQWHMQCIVELREAVTFRRICSILRFFADFSKREAAKLRWAGGGRAAPRFAC